MSFINEEDTASLEAARYSPTTVQLRSHFATRFADRTCLVIGSAPDAVAPDLKTVDATVCVNGSGFVAQAFGIDQPDLTVISSRVSRPDNAVRQSTHRIWSGLKTTEVLLIDVARETEMARQVIASAGLQFEAFQSIQPAVRAVIVSTVCGMELGWGTAKQRISNGLVAACLPVWAGARRVILAGFSTRGGHAYIEGSTRRGHLNADEAFLHAVARLPLHVQTTSLDLSNRFGLALT